MALADLLALGLAEREQGGNLRLHLADLGPKDRRLMADGRLGLGRGQRDRRAAHRQCMRPLPLGLRRRQLLRAGSRAIRELAGRFSGPTCRAVLLIAPLGFGLAGPHVPLLAGQRYAGRLDLARLLQFMPARQPVRFLGMGAVRGVGAGRALVLRPRDGRPVRAFGRVQLPGQNRADRADRPGMRH